MTSGLVALGAKLHLLVVLLAATACMAATAAWLSGRGGLHAALFNAAALSWLATATGLASGVAAKDAASHEALETDRALAAALGLSKTKRPPAENQPGAALPPYSEEP